MTATERRLVIPTVMSSRTYRALQRLGFRFTNPGNGLAYENDRHRLHAGGPMDQEVILPDGWHPVASRGRIRTDLYDGCDRRRGTLSVRLAALIGGHPFVLFTRYAVEEVQPTSFKPGERAYVVIDRQRPQRPLYRSPTRFTDAPSPIADAARQEAEAWLRRTFQDWQDPSAYWDTTPGDDR